MDGIGWPSSSSSDDLDSLEDTPRSTGSVSTNPFDDGLPQGPIPLDNLSNTAAANGSLNGHTNGFEGTNGINGFHAHPHVPLANGNPLTTPTLSRHPTTNGYHDASDGGANGVPHAPRVHSSPHHNGINGTSRYPHPYTPAGNLAVAAERRARGHGTPRGAVPPQHPNTYRDDILPPHLRGYARLSGVPQVSSTMPGPSMVDSGRRIQFGGRAENPIYNPQAAIIEMERQAARSGSTQTRRSFGYDNGRGTPEQPGSGLRQVASSVPRSGLLNGNSPHAHTHAHPAAARLNGVVDSSGSNHRQQEPVPPLNPQDLATLNSTARNGQNGGPLAFPLFIPPLPLINHKDLSRKRPRDRHSFSPGGLKQAIADFKRDQQKLLKEVPGFIGRREVIMSSDLMDRVLAADMNEMQMPNDGSPRRGEARHVLETIRTAEIHVDDDVDCLTDEFWRAKPKHEIEVKENTLLDSYGQTLKNKIEVTEVFDFRKSAQATSPDASGETDKKRAQTEEFIASKVLRAVDPLKPSFELERRAEKTDRKARGKGKEVEEKGKGKEEYVGKKGKGKEKAPGQN